MNGVHAGSGSVSLLPSVSPAWMAVTGRQNMYVYFASQQAISEFVTAARPMASKRAAVSKSIVRAKLPTLALQSAVAERDRHSAVADCSAGRLVAVARPSRVSLF